MAKPAIQLLKEKAKAVAAGIGVILAGEALVLVTDQTVQAQVQHALPLTWQPYVPIFFGVIIGGIVHQIPNAKALEDAARAAIPEPPAAAELPADPS